TFRMSEVTTSYTGHPYPAYGKNAFQWFHCYPFPIISAHMLLEGLDYAPKCFEPILNHNSIPVNLKYEII
ncbi:hypothetical protein L873DRAFT_1824395, partial [Choiromyces venosus 120613-1]